MVPPKICPICKEKVIANWESTCQHCWDKLVEHDLCKICKGIGTVAEEIINGNHHTEIMKCPECEGSGYTGIWRLQIIVFNHVRENCRRCGFDPIVEMPF